MRKFIADCQPASPDVSTESAMVMVHILRFDPDFAPLQYFFMSDLSWCSFPKQEK